MESCRSHVYDFNFQYDFREVLANEKRYTVGLGQLETAAKSVGALQLALEELQPKLAEGAAAVMATSELVMNEKEGVALVEENVLADQEEADEQVSNHCLSYLFFFLWKILFK